MYDYIYQHQLSNLSVQSIVRKSFSLDCIVPVQCSNLCNNKLAHAVSLVESIYLSISSYQQEKRVFCTYGILLYLTKEVYKI